MIALQGFFACKSDDISPQPSPQISSERVRNLIETNHWQAVKKPTDNAKIIFLKDVNKATQFFQNLKIKSPSQIPKPTQVNNEMVLSHGVFTFLNGENAHIDFETSMDGKGEILGIDLGGGKITFTQTGNYVEILKWGTIALPMYEEEFIRLGSYQYYHVPVATYKAFLGDNGWSSVQFLLSTEQANFDGNGTWEAFYLNRNPSVSPTLAPWIPNFFPI